ncbi:MAG: hypothetical protein LUG18_10360 [Candidatus Azobacteroides sp.]|nr:hypothetical protein [Candidatus Azobacteroides sp.]
MRKLTIFLLSLLVTCIASAKIYYVSPDGDNSDGSSWSKAFRSLTDAEGKVETPSEIWVKQGTYTIADATLTIANGINVYGGFTGTETALEQRSTDPALTILKGDGSQRVVTAAEGLTVETIWDGFTIQDGNDGNGGGIRLRSNSTLQNCIVQNNKNSINSGGGVYMECNETDSVKLIDCIVRNNILYYDGTTTSPVGGGGVFIALDSHAAVIRGCTIENNKVNGEGFSTARIYGGGIFMNAGSVISSTVKGNEATSIDPENGTVLIAGDVHAGGIMVMTPQTGTLLIRNTLITDNKAVVKQGGGLMINPYWTSSTITATVNVEESVIINNYSRGQGGGIFCDSQYEASEAIYHFQNCIIANNEAEYNPGGGVFINNKGRSVVSFMQCTVVNNRMNTYNYGGAGIYYNNIGADITNCVFWGNLNAGEQPLKHHVRTVLEGVTNKLEYCAFDTRFVISDVSIESNPANLDDMVSVELENTGEGTQYVRFVNPTGFSGIAKTEEEKEAIATVSFALTEGSACIDAGATVRSLKYDILGNERPMGDGYDIGAYEFNPDVNSVGKLPDSKGNTVYGTTGAIVIVNEIATQAYIYNPVGALYQSATLAAGENTIAVQPGLYIVKIQDKAVKVLVK